MGPASAAVSSRECPAAGGLRDPALADIETPTGAWRMAGRGNLGAASGPGGIGGVDQRDEEHGIGVIFPALDLFLRRRNKQAKHIPTDRSRLALRINSPFRGPGNGKQSLHRHPAGFALPVRLVVGGPLAVAQPAQGVPRRSHDHRLQYRRDLDTGEARGHVSRSSPGRGIPGRNASSDPPTQSGFISAN